MQLIVDANVVLAAEKLELFSPEYLFKEFEKHKDEILKKSGISEDELAVVLGIVQSRIKIVPSEELLYFLKGAQSISPDPDDAPYFALALKLRCPIWSNDKKLKEQPNVRIFSTKDLVELLNSGG